MPKLKQIRTLSVIHPWAHCIVSRGKIVENRNWSTNMRGYFAIHASKAVERHRFEQCRIDYRINLDPECLAFQAIVGFAELVDVVTKHTATQKQERWFTGKYGLVLRNQIALKTPVPIKGSRMFWALKGRPLEKALAQLPKVYLKKLEGNALQNR